MSNSILLGGDEDLIHIPLYFQVKRNAHGVRQFKIYEEEEAKKLMESEGHEIEVLNTKWKPQTWQLNSHLLKNSTSYNQATGQNDIDFNKYQDNLFNTSLVEWDMVDGNGKNIAVSPTTIGQLPISIASELIKLYQESTSIAEEELKK